MVYESHPWKQDLLYRKQRFIKYNTIEQFERDSESAYTEMEKAVFYSAFIIRKLVDCRGKLSDDADQFVLHIEKFKPLKEVDLWHRWPDEDTHDWDNPERMAIKGKQICNWLIHSYMFFFNYNETKIVDGFYVTSDYDKNKYLYFISISDWLDYMSFIANDNVVVLESQYDPNVHDYIFAKKSEQNRIEDDTIWKDVRDAFCGKRNQSN